MQAAFRTALLSGDPGPLSGILVGDKSEVSRGFRIHENTFLGSLVEVIGNTYPVIHRMVGAEFFQAMAVTFVRQDPPQAPHLSSYGSRFADFLAAFVPTRPYLAEVARLEWARVEANFAAEAITLDCESLQHLSPEQASGLKLTLHPSVRLLASRFPIWQLWEAHQHPVPDLSRIQLDDNGENLMILRDDQGLRLRLLSAGELAFLHSLGQESSLGLAAEQAWCIDPNFSLQIELEICLSIGVFCALVLP